MPNTTEEYYSGDRIKKNEIYEVCSTWGGRGAEVHTGFLWGNLMERNHSEDQGKSERFASVEIKPQIVQSVA